METSYKEQVKKLDTTSKAGQLARELNAERNRLKQELEEAQVQVEDLTPVTPEGTIDSYIKWLATILAVSGVFLQSADFMTAGKVAYAFSSIAWIYVGHCWNDKAIMIGSAITGTAVLMNLAELFA